jgi:hypothetical protein
VSRWCPCSCGGGAHPPALLWSLLAAGCDRRGMRVLLCRPCSCAHACVLWAWSHSTPARKCSCSSAVGMAAACMRSARGLWTWNTWRCWNCGWAIGVHVHFFWPVALPAFEVASGRLLPVLCAHTPFPQCGLRHSSASQPRLGMRAEVGARPRTMLLLPGPKPLLLKYPLAAGMLLLQGRGGPHAGAVVGVGCMGGELHACWPRRKTCKQVCWSVLSPPLCQQRVPETISALPLLTAIARATPCQHPAWAGAWLGCACVLTSLSCTPAYNQLFAGRARRAAGSEGHWARVICARATAPTGPGPLSLLLWRCVV